ncbi:hypothetical protein B0H34DRAFT_675584, partial [Crassisporium funariophilum]
MTALQHTPSSDVSLIALGKMGVKIQPMKWRANGETEAMAYGHVSLITLRKMGVKIQPMKWRTNGKTEAMAYGQNSFGGVVDYILAYGDKTARDRIIQSKALAFSDPEMYKMLQCNIYEAKPEDLFTPTTCLPQAAIAAIIKAQDLRLKTFRGCVTSGKRWVFFVYSAENPGHGQGKTVHWLNAIPLGDGLDDPIVNLELILGILRGW